MLPLHLRIRVPPSKCWLFLGFGLKHCARTEHMKQRCTNMCCSAAPLPSQNAGASTGTWGTFKYTELPESLMLTSFIKPANVQMNRWGCRKAHKKNNFQIWGSWKVNLNHFLNCCPCPRASSVAHWHLNVTVNSCWLQTRPWTSLNITLFERLLCCAYQNSNYSSYNLKKILFL